MEYVHAVDCTVRSVVSSEEKLRTRRGRKDVGMSINLGHLLTQCVINAVVLILDHLIACPAHEVKVCLPFQFTKRDTIKEIEAEVQRRWERERTFEIDAPKVRH